MSSSHIFSYLILSRAAAVGILTVNRPDKLNALNREIVLELSNALTALAADETLGALIITGAGDKAFIAGGDIGEARDQNALDILRGAYPRVMQQIEDFPRPTIAAVRGYCLGVGVDVASACDIRLCSESAQFGLPEVKLGVIPGGGVTQRLPRIVGLGRAKEMIYSGDVIDAAEALRIGLANRVVPDTALLEEAQRLGDKFSRRGRLAMRAAKLALNQSAGGGQPAGLIIETLAQALCFDSAEKKSRMTEFLEKR